MAWTPIYPGEVLVDQDLTSRTVTAPESAPSGSTYKIRLLTKPGGNFLIDSAKAVGKMGFRVVSKWIIDPAIDYAQIEAYTGNPETGFHADGLTQFPNFAASAGIPADAPQEVMIDFYAKFSAFTPGGEAYRWFAYSLAFSSRNIATDEVVTGTAGNAFAVAKADILANDMWVHLFCGLAGIPGQTAEHVESWFSEVPPVSDLRLFGAPFDGFDRGATVEIDRGIRWIDTIGGVPVGIETGDPNGATDRWRVRTAFSVKADKKAAIESTLPPYGTATNIATQSREIVLPHRFGLPSFPGLGPAVQDVEGDTYGGCTVRGFSSNGQRGVVVDLYDYELELEIPATTDGNYVNDPTPLNGTAPAILATKFKAHQINDFSFTSSTIDAAGLPTYYQPITQHGRRTDWGWNLDHLNITQASAVTAFFRAARANRVMIGGQYYKLLRLSWTGVGPWWDGALETVKA